MSCLQWTCDQQIFCRQCGDSSIRVKRHDAVSHARAGVDRLFESHPVLRAVSPALYAQVESLGTGTGAGAGEAQKQLLAKFRHEMSNDEVRLDFAASKSPDDELAEAGDNFLRSIPKSHDTMRFVAQARCRGEGLIPCL